MSVGGVYRSQNNCINLLIPTCGPIVITLDDKRQLVHWDLALDISKIDLNSEDWGGWVMYYFYQLKVVSKSKRGGFDLNSGLSTWVNELQDRMRTKLSLPNSPPDSRKY